MTDRPVIFSGPMVRAIITGRKSIAHCCEGDRACPEDDQPADGEGG